MNALRVTALEEFEYPPNTKRKAGEEFDCFEERDAWALNAVGKVRRHVNDLHTRTEVAEEKPEPPTPKYETQPKGKYLRRDLRAKD